MTVEISPTKDNTRLRLRWEETNPSVMTMKQTLAAELDGPAESRLKALFSSRFAVIHPEGSWNNNVKNPAATQGSLPDQILAMRRSSGRLLRTRDGSSRSSPLGTGELAIQVAKDRISNVVCWI